MAEDDEKSDRLLKLLLKTITKEVLHAKTGIEAVEVCRNNPDIDVVLMDIKMPEMDGYEATRQIRKFNKDVVIIMQTAHGLSGDREDAIEAGCNDYILKPIMKGEIITMIKKCIK
ncbi:MAG: response regulator [Ignavibacteriae bacterium]|nr:response regulator [Ignavibacteriota bacterium]